MSMLHHFKRLETLILERTTGDLQGALRNQLALLREHVEAYQESSDKQDATLARQAAEISRLQKELEPRGCGVTLKTGNRVMYDADFYAFVPSKANPEFVEFRKSNKANRTYRTVGCVKWADVSALHGCDFPTWD